MQITAVNYEIFVNFFAGTGGLMKESKSKSFKDYIYIINELLKWFFKVFDEEILKI